MIPECTPQSNLSRTVSQLSPTNFQNAKSEVNIQNDENLVNSDQKSEVIITQGSCESKDHLFSFLNEENEVLQGLRKNQIAIIDITIKSGLVANVVILWQCFFCESDEQPEWI
ncbi:hypothetical protein FGO68_gene15892 [Halteria grandinella]|uniref:Uncharacterized protein n=1 Tax=Halteria grandinella TaxID=5974 RepID=A0A8J8NCV3_HALGN|nr:hypothetical protein FGO68_gene15892 [Halteria grandinella]